MKQYPNFYENLAEAHIRLNKTVVLYDGEPHQILAICEHKKDGIFRIYSYPIGISEQFQIPPPINAIPPAHPTLGPAIDTWMGENKTSILQRKHMNSPKFDRFKPFPLGMCNFNNPGNNAPPTTMYLERQPLRPNTAQGLIPAMIMETEINTSPYKERPVINDRRSLNRASIRACIMGDHPSTNECLAALLDPQIMNEAAAFHRHFALVLGPIDMVFLAYKTDVVGALPHADFTKIRLGRNYRHLAEVVEKLNLFGQIL